MRNGASDKLSRGEAKGFEQAMDLYYLAACEELDPREACDEKIADQFIEARLKIGSDIDLARYMYADAMKAFAHSLRQKGLNDIAQCVESGDYSSLAI